MYEVDWEKLYEGCTGTLGTIFKILTINLKLFQDKKLIKKEQNKAKPMLICLFKKQKNKKTKPGMLECVRVDLSNSRNKQKTESRC